MSRSIGNDVDAFITSAKCAVLECTNPKLVVRVPGFEPNLQEGEFIVKLNAFRGQIAAIERLTDGMSDEDACEYVQIETNKALQKMGQGSLMFIRRKQGTFRELIPSVSIERVFCLHYDSRRFFIGVGKGTIVA